MKRIDAARVILAAALGGVSVGQIGCQKHEPVDDRPLLGSRYGKPVPVESSWREFALENYRGMVLAEIRAQPDATFAVRPDVRAIRRDNGALELEAFGEMDINDVKGNRQRKAFVVVWRKSGGGWDPVNTTIMPGRPSPAPLNPVATTGPAIAPPIRPTTPADPTAMPPPTARPSAAPAPSPAPGLPPSGGAGSTGLPPSGGSGSPSLPSPP